MNAEQQQELIINAITTRRRLLEKMMDGPGRDINSECGYPESIEAKDYRDMYDREGIAARVVQCLPDESWAVMPTVYETEDVDETAWEARWNELEDRFSILQYLYRADLLSGIGRFGIVLLGVDDGRELNEPIEGMEDGEGEGTPNPTRELLYIKVFDESVVTIKQWENDTKNPRFGLPVLYTISMKDRNRDVHWTRVIHIADNCRTSEVYGTPRMKDVYNRLFDIRKVLSGSGEMFWKGAFPGYSFETNPDVGDEQVTLDADSIREEFVAYSKGLQRYLALTGVTAKSLSPQVSDPKSHVETHLKAIAISKSIPYRILFGSEQGELASSQDERAWNKRMAARQERYITPRIIEPTIDRLIGAGVLPSVETYHTDWPDLYNLSEKDKAEIAAKQTEAISKYVQGGVDVLIPPRTYLQDILGMPADKVEAVMEELEEHMKEEKESESDEGNAPPNNPRE